uniref:PrgI family protein n=1 Tax=Clostridium botulinum TaxID=1491 RepID=A0A0A0UTL5_CLOBO|nr:hypothetical protein [Clostridium botulinum]
MGIAIAINIPLYWYGRKVLGDDFTSWLVILTAIPLMAIGFVQYNGMNFEELLIAIINFEILTPQKRNYKVNNFFEIMDGYILKEESKNKVAKLKGMKKIDIKKI